MLRSKPPPKFTRLLGGDILDPELEVDPEFDVDPELEVDPEFDVVPELVGDVDTPRSVWIAFRSESIWATSLEVSPLAVMIVWRSVDTFDASAGVAPSLVKTAATSPTIWDCWPLVRVLLARTAASSLWSVCIAVLMADHDAADVGVSAGRSAAYAVRSATVTCDLASMAWMSDCSFCRSVFV
jgi:hypothetical protein